MPKLTFINNDPRPMLESYLQERLLNHGKFTLIRKLGKNEAGKNKDAALVYSRSKKDYARKKQWIDKPLFSKFVNTNLVAKYDLVDATYDVFFGQLSKKLFGVDKTASLKFSTAHKGSLSQVVGDTIGDTMDLVSFINTFPGRGIPPEAQQSFIESILYSLIILNRDMRLENFIIKHKPEGAAIIYGIDYEFALGDRPRLMKLKNMLEILLNNSLDISRVFFDSACAWNKFDMGRGLSSMEIKYLQNLLFGYFTRDKFLSTLEALYFKLKAKNFAICYEVLIKIEKKLHSNPGPYSQQDIKKIVQIMRTAIARVRENVEDVEEFLHAVEHKEARKAEIKNRWCFI